MANRGAKNDNGENWSRHMLQIKTVHENRVWPCLGSGNFDLVYHVYRMAISRNIISYRMQVVRGLE